jgi:hypothetical protein
LNNEVATRGKRGRSIGKPKSKTVSQKRKNTSDSVSGKVCRACEGFHSTQHCYYLFRKKAPETWIPRPHLQKLVEQNLKDDSTLEEEVKRWTKKQAEIAVD